jgi:hypothetical protein
MKKQSTRQFPSIAAAASSLNVSETILKNAKRMGCKAFKARGSVDEAELLKFIAEHEKELTTGGVALRDQKMTEEIRKLRIVNDRGEGKLVLKSEVLADGHKFAAWQKDYLSQKLIKEYPSVVAGLDVAGAVAYGRRVVAAICESTQEMLKELEKLGKK